MDNIHGLLGFLLIFLIQIEPSVQGKSRMLQFHMIHTDFNRNYISNYTVSIQNGNSTIDLEIDIIRNISHNVWNLVTVEMKVAKKQDYRRIIQYDIDFCDILQKTKEDRYNLLNIWFNNVLKYGTLPTQCPILLGQYYWRNFKIQPNSIPPFMLNGMYRIGVMMYRRVNESPEMLLNSTVYAVIRMK